MATPTLPQSPSIQEVNELILLNAWRIGEAVFSPKLSRCEHSDGSVVPECHQFATVYELESGNEFCLAHFEERQ